MAQVQEELNGWSSRLEKARENLEIKSILDNNKDENNDNSKRNNPDYFQGRRNLNILYPYDRTQIMKLKEALKQISGITIDGEASTEENFSINLVIAEPTPLNSILQELSLVESTDIKGNTINLKLMPSKNGSHEFTYN